jgi:hypothetical protein
MLRREKTVPKMSLASSEEAARGVAVVERAAASEEEDVGSQVLA